VAIAALGYIADGGKMRTADPQRGKMQTKNGPGGKMRTLIMRTWRDIRRTFFAFEFCFIKFNDCYVTGLLDANQTGN